MPFNVSKLVAIVKSIIPSVETGGLGATLFLIGFGLVLIVGLGVVIYYVVKGLKNILYLTPRQFILLLFLVGLALMFIGALLA